MATTPASDTRTGYWQAQITAWQASGQAQRAFCRTHDLSYSRFVYWRGKLRAQAGEPSCAARPRPSAFVPVIGTPSARPSALSVVLPNGVELRGIAPDNLALVQQLVARWS